MRSSSPAISSAPNRKPACWWSISNCARCIFRKPPISRKSCRSSCGATAAPRRLVTAEPEGLMLEDFRAVIVPGQPRSHHLACRRPRVRHGPVRPGPGGDPGGAAGPHSRPTRPDAGRAIDLWAVHPGGKTFSMPSSARSNSHLRRSRPRARCCGGSATCPRRP